ncbi:MAG: TlpA disulfide reductase family protein [Paracoccaceae bacterium]|tara:strand:- start:182 stop:745 length:564 start_codon:yes stop_codon:yes gene_type:complete
MRFIIILLVYAHLFSFANPSFAISSKNDSYLRTLINGEMEKFVFHKDPKPVENLLVFSESGKEVDLLNLGNKFMLINFWATWCAPCVKEMPSLDQLQSLFEENDLKIFTVATGRNNQNKITSFFKKYSIKDLENFRDPKGELAISLGVFGLPASILISPKGNEIARLIGPIDWVQSDVVNFFKTITP